MTQAPLVEFEVRVEHGKIYELARASHCDNPAYLGPDPVVPPTFFTSALNFSGHTEQLVAALDLRFDRVLHGEEEVEFHGPPPRAGQRLTGATRVGERWQRSGRRADRLRFVQLVTEYRDGSGRLVATQRNTVLEHSGPAERAQP